MTKVKFRKVFHKVVLCLIGCLAVVGVACSFTINAKPAKADVLDNNFGTLSERFEGWIPFVNPDLYGYEQNRRDTYITTDVHSGDVYWDLGYVYVPMDIHVKGIDYSNNYGVADIDLIRWIVFDIRVFNSGGNSSITNFLNNIGVVPFAIGGHLYGTSSTPTFFCGGNLKAPDMNILRGNNINLPSASDWSLSSWGGLMVWQSVTCTTDSIGPYYFGFNIPAMHEYLGPLGATIAQQVYLTDYVGNAFQNGYWTGKNNVDTEAYTKGYQDGQASVGNAGAVMMSLFGSVVSVPINVMNGMGTFMIWGVPIISIIVSFLFIGLLIWVVKRFIS